MGRSVTLYFPLSRSVSTAEPILAFDCLHLPLDDGARSIVEAWETFRLPAGMQHYTEEGMEETKVDSYGDPLEYTTATRASRNTVAADGYRENYVHFLPWTRAVFQFVTSLPPEQIVILYWD